MPTPNWGPRAGQNLSDMEMDAYLQQYPPPGTTVNNVNWGGVVPGNTGANQSTVEQAAAREVLTPLWDQSGYDYWRQQSQTPPQYNSQYQTANQDQARLQQMAMIQQLQRQAAGDPNSLAQQQLTQQYGAAQNQQASLGSTMRGQSAGAAQRSIQQGQSDIQRGYAGDQQMLMLQEQQAAQAYMAQLYAQMQGQDISQAQGMAQAATNNQSLNDMMQQFYAQQGMSGDLSRLQTANDLNRANYGFDLESQRIQDEEVRRWLQAGSTAASTAANMYGGGQSNGGQVNTDAPHGDY